MKERDYNHLRSLDINRSFNYSEANPFLDKLYNNNIKNISENANIQKKYLNGLTFSLPPKHTIQNMPTHQ